jgi:hypothetical protein
MHKLSGFKSVFEYIFELIKVNKEKVRLKDSFVECAS